MSDSVSVKEFSRLIGRSHVSVYKFLNQGRLPRNPDGSIPIEEGMAAYSAIMSAPPERGGRGKKATRVYGEGAEANVKKNADIGVEHQVDERDRTPIEEVVARGADRAKDAVSINAAMTKAKLADTTYKARIRELEYKFKAGELLDKTSVEQEAQWLAEQVKSKLLAIPPRVSGLCEGRIAREIEEILTDAINGALAELQKCKYVKGDA